MFKNVKEVLSYINDNKIEMIDFKMIDIDGRWRHLTIPVSSFNEDVLISGFGFDASNYGYAPVENSDMVLIPSLESAKLDPFTEVKTLTMIGNVYMIKEKLEPFSQYPRNIVKSALDYLKELGIADEMLIGPEFEFHIFDGMEYSISANEICSRVDVLQSETSSYSSSDVYKVGTHDGYHLDIPRDIHYDIRSKMAKLLNEWGILVKYHHHEVGGSAQQEIEVNFENIDIACDNVLAAKYLIKNLAFKEGKLASFMPKPLAHEAGNGMHIHMMLFKDKQPLFYDDANYASLSDLAHYFMGGILKHIKALCAFTNPSTNSYRRLVPGFEAPVTIGYAMANRSAVIRIPAYAKTKETKRFELRNPDATANPYFAYSAVLMAGIDGIVNKIDPRNHHWGPFDYNLYDLNKEELMKIDALPTSLESALLHLEQDHEFLLKGGVFPKELIKIWIERKLKEIKDINKYPHPFEFKKYFDL